MKYFDIYKSLIGDILLISEDDFLTNLSFIDSDESYNLKDLSIIKKDSDVIIKTKKWLDIYFRKEIPNFNIPIKLYGTKFQTQVWKYLQLIPYGQTTTYKHIGDLIRKDNNLNKVSYQSIGHAISKNPIAIIIPCHRVIGSNNKLVGYAYGLKRKEYLLNLEKNKNLLDSTIDF